MMTRLINNDEVQIDEVVKSRNVEVVKNKNKERARIDSMDSQKIDSLLRHSVDNFINDTNDIYESIERLNHLKKQDKQAKQVKHIEDKYKTVPATYLNNSLGFQRSASQKYNYKNTGKESDSRFLHISPMASNEKHSNFNTRIKSSKMLNSQYSKQMPGPSQGYNAPPRYSSLMPNQYSNDQDVYYVKPVPKNDRRNTHYSFSAQRRSDQVPE